MTRRVVLTLAVVFVFACGSALVVAGAADPAVPTVGPTTDAGQATSTSELQEPPDADATVTRIRVLPNGTAEWSLTIRMQLDSDAAEREFAAFQEEFAANRSAFVDDYREPRVDAVSDAANLTGREMTATGFDAETGTEAVVRQRGFVTYQFRWVGFAPVENGTVRAGDVFENGLFIEENGIIVIESPDGYEATTVEPDPDETSDGELRWEGPVSFADRRPSAVFVPADSPSDDPGDTTDDSPDGTTVEATEGPEDDDSGGLSVGTVLFGTAGLAVLVGVGAFYLYRRRQHPDPDDTPPSDDAAAGVGAGGAQTATETDEMPDLATDEDRVIGALKAEDGRMRQSELADELDWSPSKASRVLSDMADDGEIEKLRIGRENVIDLVDDDQ